VKTVALDPGNTHTALVILDHKGSPTSAAYEPNDKILDLLKDAYYDCRVMAIEMIASYGMPVGAEVFDTCVWIGRFTQAWPAATVPIFRKDVKMHLCGQTKAKDKNVRQALIDRFGPGKDKAIGKKAKPGPLYGYSGDLWAALAVAVTYYDSVSRIDGKQSQ
jgi:hypothetical protein